MSTILYELQDFKFQYKDKSEQAFILGPLNIAIAQGKLTSILGRSGSGKTTLLTLLGLLRKHEGGELAITTRQTQNAKDIWNSTTGIEAFRANHIGFALQKGELLPHLSLYDNAALILRYLGQTEKTIKSKLQPKFEALYPVLHQSGQLEKLTHSKPFNVSQGQYQRGAIVRALANEPAIVLADEPTGNLDQHSGERAMRIFRQIVKKDNADEQPQSVIVVTHDILLAIEYADEIIILKSGKIAEHFVLNQTTEKTWIAQGATTSEAYSDETLREKILTLL